MDEEVSAVSKCDSSMTGSAHDEVNALGEAFIRRESTTTTTTTTSVTQDVATASAINDKEPRLLQSFFQEVQQSPPFLQRLHLRMFLQRLDGFLTVVATNPELVLPVDLESLLLLLLSLFHRRGGLTPLQERVHNECSDTSLVILQRMTATIHPAMYRTRDAWVTILANVNLSTEAVMNGLAGPPLLPEGPADPVLLDEVAADIASRVTQLQEEAQVERSALMERIDATEALPADLLKTTPPFAYHPHWYTLDCIPPHYCGGLTELEFQRVEGWFASLEQNNGRFVVTPAVKAQAGLMGVRVLNRHSMSQWTRMFPDGCATLADVLAFLFRGCHRLVIQHRIEGLCLGLLLNQFPNDIEPPVPTALRSHIRLPDAHEAAEQLFACGLAERVDVLRCTLLLKRIFDAADPHRTENITVASLKACLGRYADKDGVLAHGRVNVLAPFDNAQQQRVSRDPTGAITLKFPHFTAAVLGLPIDDAALCRALIEAERVEKWQLTCSVYQGRKNEQEIRAAVEKNMPKVASKPLTVPLRLALRQRHEALSLQLDRVCALQRSLAVREAELRRKIHDLNAWHDRVMQSKTELNKKNVVLVQGPTEKEVEAKHPSGLVYTTKIFQLAPYLDDDSKRADVICLLKAFDALNIHPQLFLCHSQKRATHYIQPLLSDFGRVYRDCAVAPRRPGARTYWTGAQHIHIKTNIAVRSDIKYLLLIEGYNPGSNSPIQLRVVGHASRGLSEVGELEKYGWPAGWDAHTVTNMTGGVRSATQYSTTDGFVAVQLDAMSFSQVGITVTGFAVTPHFGGGAPIGCTIYHCNNPL